MSMQSEEQVFHRGQMLGTSVELLEYLGAKQEKIEQMKLNILLANLRIVHKKTCVKY